MEQTERVDDFQEGLRLAIRAAQAGIWTALPGIVQSFNSVKMTAVIQPSIKFRIRRQNDFEWVPLPLLLDCPVQFINGGPFVITTPIQAGDECLVIFSSRCIDSWWALGGVQMQAEIRMHDLSDGFCLVGPFSQPNVLSGISTTSLQIRTKAGAAYIELTSDGKVNIVAPGGVHVTGTVDATGEGTFNGGHTVSAHRHGGVQSGGSLTNTPTG